MSSTGAKDAYPPSGRGGAGGPVSGDEYAYVDGAASGSNVRYPSSAPVVGAGGVETSVAGDEYVYGAGGVETSVAGDEYVYGAGDDGGAGAVDRWAPDVGPPDVSVLGFTPGTHGVERCEPVDGAPTFAAAAPGDTVPRTQGDGVAGADVPSLTALLRGRPVLGFLPFTHSGMCTRPVVPAARAPVSVPR